MLDPKKATWVPAIATGPDEEGMGRYWVGFWNDNPPTPEDLQHRHANYGAPVELGDGQTWVIPTTRNFTVDFLRDPKTGGWKSEVQLRYQEAHFGAINWWRKLKDTPLSEVPWFEVSAFVESVLQLNYRLLPEVSHHLRLFNSENITAAMLAIIQAAGQTASQGAESDEQ